MAGGPVPAGKIDGYDTFLFGAGWNCPGLKLYGYSTLRQLGNAIRRELRKRAKKNEEV